MNESDFLEVIRQDPSNDNNRLIYADWLDEQGDLRGQLIRLSVELRRVALECALEVEWLEDLRIHEDRPLIVKRFGRDFHSDGGALTLNAGDVSEEVEVYRGFHERTHTDGWRIRGEVHEDYYIWVNSFEAIHNVYGRVWGDFESTVFADSEEGFQHFYKHHTPESWDYMDI